MFLHGNPVSLSGWPIHPDENYRIYCTKAMVKIFQNSLDIFEHGIQLEQNFIQPKEVEDYKRERQSKAADGTVIKELRTLKAILNRAVKDQLIHYSPIEHVAASKNLTSKPHRFCEKFAARCDL